MIYSVVKRGGTEAPPLWNSLFFQHGLPFREFLEPRQYKLHGSSCFGCDEALVR